jgi:FecR protein
MNRRLLVVFLTLLGVAAVLPAVAWADTSHARIVRLSLVQGDVRFTSSFHNDPLTDPKAIWETAVLNIPIRQGYILSTENGRAEVEFENGAMAFLGPNSVIEFYDLTLHDGDRITRLVLRQGTTTLYANPRNGDYFSVTGGDFTVEAVERTTFRLDNYDDGSAVNVQQGHVSVVRDEKSTALEKGQSLSVRAGNAGDMTIGRVADRDDFDQWVSGRIESVVTATNYSSQYVTSPNYSAGFADLYTYGSFYNVGGYGNCWRPFGVGFGWSPFDYGNWYSDPIFGWSFLGSAPWGWLPYHYGGWIFSPMYGWLWAPTGFGFYGRPIYYRPVTAVWVRNGNNLGIVPLHPADNHNKTPLNLGQGIYSVQGRGTSQTLSAATGEKWTVLKQAPRETLSGNLAATSSPTRVSRTLLTGNATSRPVTLSRESSIVYDPVEHRFVSANKSPANAAANAKSPEASTSSGAAARATGVVGGSPRTTTIVTPNSSRSAAPPRPIMTPAPARTSGGSSGRSSGGATWGGSRSSGSSTGSSHPSAPSAPHPSVGGIHPH